MQHRGRRSRPGDDSGGGRARRAHSQVRCEERPPQTPQPQGPEPDTAGHKGFFYHFLDIDTGHRVWNCELSTLDSAFLFAGALTCATYFDADTEEEADVRRLADALYRRAEWDWACNGGPTLT